MKAILFVTLAFIAIACALRAPSTHNSRRVHLEYDAPRDIPMTWEISEAHADKTELKEVHFYLKQQNRDKLESLFWKVSNPQNKEHYAKYLSIDQISEIVQPKQETIRAVTAWLKSHGVEDFTFNSNKDVLTAEISVETLEKMLMVQFHNYEHTSGYKYTATFDSYSVPAHVAAHLDLISGVIGVPKLSQDVQRLPRNAPRPAASATAITPDVIRTRYNVTANLICTNSNSSHAVAEFQEQYYSPSDLTDFFNKYVTVGSTFDTVANVTGKNDPTEPGDEANLDIQYIMGVAPNATTWFISTAPYPFWSDLLKWVALLTDTVGLPWVHSISYGAQGDYPSAAYRNRLDGDLQEVGLRGVSVIFASGDYGAGCNGVTVEDASTCKLDPAYPSTNIYVTAVGATGFISGNTGPEEAVNYPGRFMSGGGFDWVFPRPSYQNAAVTNYVNTASKVPPPGAWNSTNRATPDVSALGSIEFDVIIDHRVTPIGGTSAAAPTFAAIITLLNDYRFNNGVNSPLGFLNQWLYQTSAANSTAFFDVTIGNNRWECCSGLNATQFSGYECIAGWDPVSGLGTPNYATLVNYAVQDFEKVRQ